MPEMTGHRPFQSTMELEATSRLLSPYLGQLSVEELDALPFGVVEIDSEGRVLSYNQAEADDTGFESQRPIGRDFFTEVAPSAFSEEVFGRYVEGFSTHQLEAQFRFTFTHGALPRTVQMRMYYSARTSSIWIFIANPDGSPLARAA